VAGLRARSKRTDSVLASFRSEDFTKAALDGWGMGLRDRGLTPGGINVRIRTMNSFCSWLHEEGHTDTRLKLKLLRAPKKQITPISPADVRMLLLFRPKGLWQVRTWTLVLLLLDTGLRIDEALGIEVKHVDLDQLTLKVWGKGSRERLVPFSYDMRKHLYRWMSKGPESRYLFSTQLGARLMYQNCYRDVTKLCTLVGIKTHVHPHLLRHGFACSYISGGGDIYRLSRLLGHTSVSTTQLYLRSMGIEQFRARHDVLSPLSSSR
jgi:site-specific recombinase XerD